MSQSVISSLGCWRHCDSFWEKTRPGDDKKSTHKQTRTTVQESVTILIKNMQPWFCPPSHRGLPDTHKPSKQRSVFPASSKDEHDAENKKRPSLGAFWLKTNQKISQKPHKKQNC
jgi:hypothetical protein